MNDRWYVDVGLDGLDQGYRVIADAVNRTGAVLGRKARIKAEPLRDGDSLYDAQKTMRFAMPGRPVIINFCQSPTAVPAVSRQRRKARRAGVRDPGGTSPYSYSAQRYSYSVIAPAMERMLNPCRSTTSAYEYEYRDAEYDCDPCAGP